MATKRRRNRMNLMVVAEQAVKYGFTPPKEVAPAERFISPNEAARILNITGEAVKQWIYRRRLPAVKLSNGYWRIRVNDLQNFMTARQDLTHRRILIYDRPGKDAGEVVKLVEQLEHLPVIAHNSMDAMLKAADLTPAIFVVNLSHHEMDAWALIKALRKNGKLRRLPIVILADRELSPEEEERAVQLGVQACLKRPITSASFKNEINQILDRVL